MSGKKPFKIVQLLPELNEGGVERGVVELNREFVKQGLDSFVISSGGGLADQIGKDGGSHVCYDVCSKNPLTAPKRIYGLRRILREINPDILHARSRVPAWLTYLANKSLHYPFVTTVHGLNSVNKYSQIMTRGDRVIVVGEPVRDHILNNYPINKDHVRLIQRGVDLDKFNPADVDTDFINEFKDRYRLNGKFVVCSVGRITWLKDYETFIAAIAKLKETIPEIVGLIVGGVRVDKEDYLEKLKGLARELGVAENIVFTGSQKQVAEICYLSDVLVNASLKMGNIGRTIIESFALDTPVIATSYEGLTDLVIDGVNGYLVKTRDPDDLADKISKARTDKFINIRQNLNPDYTLPTMVDKTIAVYRELL